MRAFCLVAQTPQQVGTATGGLSDNSAIVTFALYIAVVLWLAWLSSRLRAQENFLTEYFLGGRRLGVWAFALTFAATSASGGSFIGFPSLVYTHGWSVGLWIASYMLMPLVALGLLAKRLNQLARRSGAITVPDLLHARFGNSAFGLIATLLIIFFLTFNLVAQFKGGSVILQTLLQDVPLFQLAVTGFANWLPTEMLGASVDPAYLLCLLVFAVAVVAYTTYGGFRAVVWTDVLQGFVMVVGIMILLPMTLGAVGGLTNATEQLAAQHPPQHVRATLRLANKTPNDGANLSKVIRKNSLIVATAPADQTVHLLRLEHAVRILSDGRVAGDSTAERAEGDLQQIAALELSVPVEQIKYESVVDGFELIAPLQPTKIYAYGAGEPGHYTSLPGPSPSSANGFLPLSIAFSFFVFWCFASAGQPSNMIRCMAFHDSRTLAKAIFTVSVYFSLIYFPIVIIFCCGRWLLPGWETSPDRIMPEMARTVTSIYGVPWLAGLLVAAPFAAVMSTMDSFLLMISSSVVRDIYCGQINPNASQRRIKALTYCTTCAVGVAALAASINPPKFLQDIIVFTGAGLATSFLVPVALSMYWPRFNHQGAIAGMLTGFFSNVLLYAIGYYLNGKMTPFQPFGLSPFLVGCLTSLVASLVICRATPPPSREIVLRFFYRSAVEIPPQVNCRKG